MKVEAEVIGVVLPGWSLLISETDSIPTLFLSNGASIFAFDCKELYGEGRLTPDPFAGLSDAEINSIPSDSKLSIISEIHWRQVDYVESCLLTNPERGYDLMNSALQSGYEPEIYGERISSWLIGQIVKTIARKDRSLAMELRPYIDESVD